MKTSAIVNVQFKSDGLNPEAPAINENEIDLEFEELEEKTAPQSDTTYLEAIGRPS
jgi:hypothetical protein